MSAPRNVSLKLSDDACTLPVGQVFKLSRTRPIRPVILQLCTKFDVSLDGGMHSDAGL